jgi:hypothetical protein
MLRNLWIYSYFLPSWTLVSMCWRHSPNLLFLYGLLVPLARLAPFWTDFSSTQFKFIWDTWGIRSKDVDDELCLGDIASLESNTPSNRANLLKKQSIVVRGNISHIHKVKQNNVLISPSICFSISAIIDGPTINGLLLVVEAFTVFFDHFFLILFL